MFIPTIPCTVRLKYKTNVYGEASLSEPVAERCNLVRMRVESEHTTVRADSSATRGYADEFAASNVILLAPNTAARFDDQITVLGVSIRVKSLHPRYDVQGRIDHFEVRGEAWV